MERECDGKPAKLCTAWYDDAWTARRFVTSCVACPHREAHDGRLGVVHDICRATLWTVEYVWSLL